VRGVPRCMPLPAARHATPSGDAPVGE